MPDFSLKALAVNPSIDLELLLENSREKDIEDPLLNRLRTEWSAWLPCLHAVHITGSAAADSWLAVWLDEAIEKKVDCLWAEAPSKAFLYNALAQTLCMSAVYALLPEVTAFGCAPLPPACAALGQALKQIGLQDKGNMKRRYAVITGYPFAGGCEVCSLRGECPRLKPNGKENAAFEQFS
ncbi:MAG: hypothetical protein LBV80_07345 [Deltaproteobacteria bacterium]|jgi:hypothetical protein|nr:hypothetical protein [Deltaproteobacteria bacterium]